MKKILIAAIFTLFLIFLLVNVSFSSNIVNNQAVIDEIINIHHNDPLSQKKYSRIVIVFTKHGPKKYEDYTKHIGGILGILNASEIRDEILLAPSRMWITENADIVQRFLKIKDLLHM